MSRPQRVRIGRQRGRVGRQRGRVARGVVQPPMMGRIDRLAKLPTRHEALTMLAAVTQAPITKLARTLNEVPSKVTRAVAAVRDQKQEAA